MSQRWNNIPNNIWVLSLGSLLANISSAIIGALSPLFLGGVFGANFQQAGVARSLAEFTGHVTKIFSGALTDIIGKRRILIILGYTFALISRPIFGLCNSIHQYTFAHMLDRFGNGLRDAPRDALIADSVAKADYGKCYFIRNAFATFGACVGPLLLIPLLKYTNSNYRFIYMLSTIPIVFSLLLFFIFLKDMLIFKTHGKRKFQLQLADIKQFDTRLALLFIISFIYLGCTFSDYFLIQAARARGLTDDSYAPIIIAVINGGFSIVAPQLSLIADKRKGSLLYIGCSLLCLSYILVYMSQDSNHYLLILFVAFFFYGIQRGIMNAALSYLIAYFAPEHLRGTVFGLYSIVNAVAVAVSSTFAGYLSTKYGIYNMFAFQAVFSGILLMIIFYTNRFMRYQTKAA